MITNWAISDPVVGSTLLDASVNSSLLSTAAAVELSMVTEDAIMQDFPAKQREQLDEPGLLEKVPIAHGVQFTVPSFAAKKPGGQAIQSFSLVEADLVLKCPNWHLTHVVFDVAPVTEENVPLGQTAHWPATEPYVPAGQFKHDDSEVHPSVKVYIPIGQLVHFSDSGCEANVPLGHAKHFSIDVVPVIDENVPMGHLPQDAAPFNE